MTHNKIQYQNMFIFQLIYVAKGNAKYYNILGGEKEIDIQRIKWEKRIN